MDYALERRIRPRNLVALERGLGNQRSPYFAMEYDRARATKPTVCKHYLRDLCKDGDSCHSIHEYDIGCMEKCKFETNCTNPFCIYQHTGRSDVRTCQSYTRGYCLNAHCTSKHVNEKICPRYLAGFCPEGPRCNMAHPRFLEPVSYIAEAVRVREFSVLPCRVCGNYHASSVSLWDIPELRESRRVLDIDDPRRKRFTLSTKPLFNPAECPLRNSRNRWMKVPRVLEPTEENFVALGRILAQIERNARQDMAADADAKRRQNAAKDSDDEG